MVYEKYTMDKEKGAPESMESKFRDVSYPLLKILPWAGALIIAVAAGTFTLTKYATEHRIAALERDVLQRDKAIQQLRLPANNLDLSLYVPDATFGASVSKEEIRSLLDKIKGLESEKGALFTELARYAKDALDPKSELLPLVKQLDSQLEKERLQAVEGLFALRDPRSVPYLVAYYNKNPDEATRGLNTSIWEWFNLLLDLDRQAGITFMLNVLAGGDRYRGDTALKFLRETIDGPEEIAKTKERLHEIALYNKDALTRTRAKLLLEYYDARGKPGFQRLEDRSIMQVILDIESEIKKLRKGK